MNNPILQRKALKIVGSHLGTKFRGEIFPPWHPNAPQKTIRKLEMDSEEKAIFMVEPAARKWSSKTESTGVFVTCPLAECAWMGLVALRRGLSKSGSVRLAQTPGPPRTIPNHKVLEFTGGVELNEKARGWEGV